MLKSSNQESIIADIAEQCGESRTNELLRMELPSLAPPSVTRKSDNEVVASTAAQAAKTIGNSNNNANQNRDAARVTEQTDTLATLQLTTGLLQIFEPPLAKARGQLKELIGKQNKIYIDLSAEKFKLDNAEVAKLHEMMNNVKIYREKLIKIRRQMQNVYQRTKVLKKRAVNVRTCKERELHRKLQKQQQEEALIAKQQAEPQPSTSKTQQ